MIFFKYKQTNASIHAFNLESKADILRHRYGRGFAGIASLFLIVGILYIPYKTLHLLKLDEARPGASAAATYASVAPSAFCPDAADYSRFKQLWPAMVTDYKARMQSVPLDTPDWGSSAAYFIVPYLNGPIEMALGCGDVGMLSDIADIYLQAANSSGYLPLTNTNGVMRRYWANATEGEPSTSSAQWMMALSRELSAIAATPTSQRTTQMNNFVSTYKSTIAGYYKYSLYTSTIWLGSNGANFINTLYANVDKKSDDLPYDFKPTIQKYLTGLAYLYMANKLDPSTVDLSGNNYPITEAQMAKTLQDGAKLLKQRSTPMQWTNLQGQAVTGYNFDAGFYQNLVDNQYSEYEGFCYPILESNQLGAASALASYLSAGTENSCTTPGYRVPIARNYETSWDTAHMYIPIMFWRAMYTVQPYTGADFPTLSDMQKYANQLAYGISNKDLTYPRFKNFWSGSNGWLRLIGTGYSAGNAPWQGTSTVIIYNVAGMLTGFNSDLRTMVRRMRDVMNAKDATSIAKTRFYYDQQRINNTTLTEENPLTFETNPNSQYWAFFLSGIPQASFSVGSGPTPTVTTTPTAAPTPTPTPTVVSGPTPAVPQGMTRVDDNVIGTASGQVEYTGNWSVNTDSSRYQGADRCSGDKAILHFAGTRAIYYGTKAAIFGIMAVSVDGGAETSVDLYSATSVHQTLLYDTGVLSAGNHTLTIRWTGTKSASSSNIYGCVDFFDYLSASVVATPTPTTIPSDPKNPESKPVTVIPATTGPVTPSTPAVPANNTITIPVDKTKQVKKVEYIVDGKVLPSNQQDPFQLDTTLLTNGEHVVTQKVTYEDGSVISQQAKLAVGNKETPILTPIIRFVRLNKQLVAFSGGGMSAMSLVLASFIVAKKKHLVLPSKLAQLIGQ